MKPSKLIWMDGDLVPWDEARVHVLSHALHYGTGVFEGIRAYPTSKGPAVFRLTEHMERLQASATAYGIPLDASTEGLVKVAKEVIAANELDEGYIRPLAHLGLGSIGLDPSHAETHLVVAAWEWGAYLGEEGLRNGITTRVSSWRRIDSASLIPNAKGTGGYLNAVVAKAEAMRAGADEAIMLNAAGAVAEGSGENLFLVHEGEVLTPPTSDGILDGITRRTVMRLLEDAGHRVVERSLARSDLYQADEAFFCGTAAEVTPIREVDHRQVGEGEPGPVTRTAQDLYARTVRGEIDDYLDWLEWV